MRAATLQAAVAHLPATTQKLSVAMGCNYTWARRVLRELVRQRLAEEWGDELNDKGVLAKVYRATGTAQKGGA